MQTKRRDPTDVVDYIHPAGYRRRNIFKKKEKKKHTGPFFLKRSKQQKERRLCDWSALEPGLKVFLLIFVGGTGGF